MVRGERDAGHRDDRAAVVVGQDLLVVAGQLGHPVRPVLAHANAVSEAGAADPEACRLGQRGSALRWYQICERTLRQELDVPPSEATRRLYLEITRSLA